MSDLFDNSTLSNDNDKGIDPELAELLMVEKQKAQFNAQVNTYIFSRYIRALYSRAGVSNYLNINSYDDTSDS
jgi:hypothetical protein